MSHNVLTGLADMSRRQRLRDGPVFPRLRVLRLCHNRLAGPLPCFLRRIQGLAVLELQGNCFTGSLAPLLPLTTPPPVGSPPPALPGLAGLAPFVRPVAAVRQVLAGPLAQLRHLDLSMNRLSGPLPESLAELRTLQYLSLHGNCRLAGPLPVAALLHLRNLRSLELHGTGLQLGRGVPATTATEAQLVRALATGLHCRRPLRFSDRSTLLDRSFEGKWGAAREDTTY